MPTDPRLTAANPSRVAMVGASDFDGVLRGKHVLGEDLSDGDKVIKFSEAVLAWDCTDRRPSPLLRLRARPPRHTGPIPYRLSASASYFRALHNIFYAPLSRAGVSMMRVLGATPPPRASRHPPASPCLPYSGGGSAQGGSNPDAPF